MSIDSVKYYLDRLTKELDSFLKKEESYERQKSLIPPEGYISLTRFGEKYEWVARRTLTKRCLTDERFKHVTWIAPGPKRYFVHEQKALDILTENPRYAKFYKLFHAKTS